MTVWKQHTPHGTMGVGSTVVSGMTTANSITINRRVEMVWTNCLRHAKAVRKLEGSNSTTCYFQPRV